MPIHSLNGKNIFACRLASEIDVMLLFLWTSSYFLPDRSRTGKQKTPVAKGTCEPKWNHTLVYDDLTLTDLRARCLEMSVWNHDKLSSNQLVGGVRLSLGTGMFIGTLLSVI